MSAGQGPRELLALAFRSFWSDQRRCLTVARAAVHQRQIENWWKVELASHLWETAAQLDCYVFVEAHDRADLVLGDLASSSSGVDPAAAICVPIELKTTGTFWKDPRKALAEPGKKRLAQDMDDALALRRAANPFAAVALLLTHRGGREDAAFEGFKSAARALGQERGLVPIVDDGVPLAEPGHGEGPVAGWQMLWVTNEREAG